MRFRAAAGGAVAGVVVLAGCTLVAPGEPAPGASGGARARPGTVEEYYAQRPDWEDCVPTGMECATVTAPLDWEEPSTGAVELAVVRLVSEGDAPVGSLLINPGGPGLSGVELVQQSAGFVASSSLRGSFDIVGWDPRGVRASTPVECLDDEGMDDYLFTPPESATGSDAWFAERAQVERGFAEACAAESGGLLAHLNTRSNARDLDLLRAVLGDERLNYLGYSYGTLLGAHYAELFPERVGRMVLDAPVDPAMGRSQQFVDQARGFENAFRAYAADCLATAGCPFTGTLDDALAQARELFAGVEARRLEAPDGRRLTSAVVGAALIWQLFGGDPEPAMTRLVKQLRDGDATLAFRFADDSYARIDDDRYEYNYTSILAAAMCADGVHGGGLEATRSTAAAMEAAAPTVGRYLAFDSWVRVDSVCQSWPVPPAPGPAPVAAPGAAPILLVGGSADPSTPYSWAQSLAGQLESAVLVTRVGGGHTSYARGNDCIDGVVEDYLVTGTPPSTDTVC